MIEQTSNTAAALQNSAATPRKVLTMVKNERMGGYVPKWAAPDTAQQKIEHTLSMAEHGLDPTQNFEAALAYSAGNPAHPAAASEEFTFGDLVDMVNPLHHIPVVGAVYRGVTGDEIKPIGQIIGGAVFGGPMGAASGLINTVIEEETGKDITENAMAFVMDGEKPSFNTKPLSENPEQRLEDAATTAKTAQDLPASLLSFTPTGAENTGFRANTFAHYKSLHHARMTGQQTTELETIPHHPEREDITKLAALTMPPKP